jgi:acetyl esterase/lipase
LGRVGPVLPTHLALAIGVHIKGVWVDPAPYLVLGKIKEWAAIASVTPIRVPGYWLEKANSDIATNAPPSPGEKVVLALHGGAYIANSAFPDDITANIAKGILEHVGSVKRVFSVEYRLSVGPPNEAANPFPTALIDAVAGYNHLINVVGFEPQNIIIEGDSAGGNLALALTRYLVEYRESLTDAAKLGSKPLIPPGGVILCSPWADMGTSHDQPLLPYLSRTDYIGNVRNPRTKYAETAFTGPFGLADADKNVYISPASKHIIDVSFTGWPRTFLLCGGVEYLAPGIRDLKERMAADMNEGSGPGQLSYYEAPDGVHDFICFTWHEPERTDALRAMAEWVDQVQ